MRKAIAELDAEEREALLYLADLGTAMCAHLAFNVLAVYTLLR